ncbi:MAG: MFS transporter [bacterium]
MHEGPDSSYSYPDLETSRIVKAVKDYLGILKLFSKNVRWYLVGSFLMGINFQVFLLLLNLYLKDAGFLESEIGLVGSVRGVGMTMVAIPAAIILSRLKLKPILILSVTFFAFFSFLIISTLDFKLILSFSFLSGVSFVFYRIAGGPFFMRNSTRKERTHIFSFSFGMMILAGMVGSLGAGKMVVLVEHLTGDLILGYQYTLYTGICLSMLALIPFLMLKTKKPTKEEKEAKITFKMLKKKRRFYSHVFIVNFLMGMGAGLVIPFLNLYFKNRFESSPDDIGLYFFLVQCSMLVGSLSAPEFARKFGLVNTVVYAQLLSIPFFLVMSYTYILPLAVIAFVIRGGLVNSGWPIVSNLSMELSDKHDQALVNALLMIAWTSSWMVSSAVGGTLIEKYGFTFTMNITICLYVLSSIAFYLFFRKTEKKDESGNWIILSENKS